MATLHIINASPLAKTSLQSCLRVIKKNDAIILIEDAVITAKKNNGEMLFKESIRFFVLEPDLKARGIKTEQIIQGVETVDYNGFVKLTVKYYGVQTWS